MGAARTRIASYAFLGVVASVLSASAPATAASVSSAGGVTAASALEAPLIERINAVRRSRRLRPLRISRQLRRAAAFHSASMGRRGFFSHRSADGTSSTRRIRSFYPSAGYSYWTVGETILWSGGRVSARSALRTWLNSPGHRSVLLSGRWSQVGLAAIRVRNAGGYFRGRDVTIITADFGARAP